MSETGRLTERIATILEQGRLAIKTECPEWVMPCFQDLRFCAGRHIHNSKQLPSRPCLKAQSLLVFRPGARGYPTSASAPGLLPNSSVP